MHAARTSPFSLLAAAVYLVGEVVTLPGRERHRAVRRAANYGRSASPHAGLERLRFRERVIAAGHGVARAASR